MRAIRDGVTAFWGTGDATQAEVADSFATWIARLIVAVSIAGALVSYQASRVSGSADGLDQRALRESNYEEVSRNQIRATVSNQMRVLAEIEDSRYADAEVRRELQSNPDSVGLQVEHLREQRRYEAIASLFNARFQTDANGALSYDPDYVQSYYEAQDQALAELRPEQARESAGREHERAVGYVRAAALLAVALFFLTVATLTARRLGRRMAVIGGLAIVVALIQYAVA
ncbi:MAG: hypothetical protein QOI10_2726 [Solirubrobacterales bacterium]|nr:hypothetical protein [Solirubrobacterales bacterium]